MSTNPEQKPMRQKFLAIGECMVELAPAGSNFYQKGYAGDSFNTAWYAKKIAPDLSVHYFSAIGDDAISNVMRGFMVDAGIVPELAVRPGRSVGLYLISLEKGERSFSYWRSVSAARSLADGLDEFENIQAGDTIFFTGITLGILDTAARARLFAAIEKARGKGALIAFDPNLRPRLWDREASMCQAIEMGASISDICLPSFEDETIHFGDVNQEATIARYQALGVKLVVLKDGSAAVTAIGEGERASVMPRPTTSIVDSTAAGDSFNAAFLTNYLGGAKLEAALRAGCELARYVIMHKGALIEPEPGA